MTGRVKKKRKIEKKQLYQQSITSCQNEILIRAQNIQIIEYPKNQSAFINSSLIFNCTATGHPRPTISWVKNDDPQALQTNPRVEEKVILLDNKTVRSQLLLTGTKMEDIGTYHCVAHNSAGERVSTVSYLLTEDLGKRHSFFAPENDNFILKNCADDLSEKLYNFVSSKGRL